MPWIGPGVANALLKVAGDRGLNVASLLARASLEPATLGDPEARLPFHSYVALWEQVARDLRDPSLPVLVAKVNSFESYQLMGFAAMTAPDGRELLERLTRFNRLFTDAGTLTSQITAEGVWIGWERGGPLELGHRLIDESVVASAVRHVREATGLAARPLAVTVRHSPPQDALIAHRTWFGCAVEGNATRVGCLFEAALLDGRPRTANGAMGRFLLDQAERRLSTVTRAALPDQVRAVVLRELSSGQVDLGRVARALAISERTLRRKLSEEGTTFKVLLDEVRREQAQALLSEGSRNVGEVAAALGFADGAAFSRAYRRWFGRSPTGVER